MRCMWILAATATLTSLTYTQAACPRGWGERRGSCYLFVVGEARSQSEAEAACVQQGSHLTSVLDEDETNYILNTVTTSCPSSCPSVWIGLTLTSPSQSNSIADRRAGWVWLDGSLYNGGWTPWFGEEPGRNEVCGRMYINVNGRTPGNWAGIGCGTQYPYVCKQRATTASTTTATPPSEPGSPEWLEWQGRFYLFLLEETFTQEEAESACVTRGGHLTSLLGPTEEEFVYNTTKSACPQCKSIWVGLRNHNYTSGVLSERRGYWTWLDGTAFSVITNEWTNWRKGEPTGDSACGRMYITEGQSGKWADIDCNRLYPCVCKTEVIPTDAGTSMTTSISVEGSGNGFLIGIGVGVAVSLWSSH